MIVALIIVFAMTFFFCIFTIVMHSILKDKIKVDERIQGFVFEEKENRQRIRIKRKKQKKRALKH